MRYVFEISSICFLIFSSARLQFKASAHYLIDTTRSQI